MSWLKRPAGYGGSELLTIIGPETFFHGSMTVRGSIRIEGEMEGNITEAQETIVGKNGRVRGNICADRAEVGGQVYGDIVCAAHLEIKAGGKVLGNIRAPKLIVEESAVFDGQCSMSQTPAVLEAAAAGK